MLHVFRHSGINLVGLVVTLAEQHHHKRYREEFDALRSHARIIPWPRHMEGPFLIARHFKLSDRI